MAFRVPEPTTRRERQAMIMSRLHGVINNAARRPHTARDNTVCNCPGHRIFTGTRSSHLPEDKDIQKLSSI